MASSSCRVRIRRVRIRRVRIRRVRIKQNVLIYSPLQEFAAGATLPPLAKAHYVGNKKNTKATALHNTGGGLQWVGQSGEANLKPDQELLAGSL